MKRGGGKQKGAEFERQVCTQLSLWVTAQKRRDCFWRSAMSGGRATIFKKQGLDLSRQAGDISAISEEGLALTNLFFIETKFYRSLELDRFALGEGRLVSFWKQADKESSRHQRFPLLIAKENHRNTLVVGRTREIERIAPGIGVHKLSRVVVSGAMIDLFWFKDLLSIKFETGVTLGKALL